MPPRSRATGFERLAPDQRAAVELVLRQGRSYGELSDMLGMPEETIRTRARGGIAALAPDLPAPARSGEIADWLLGQQSEAHAARTRELLLTDPAAQRWAATVSEPLRAAAGGESVPALPTSAEPAEPRVNGRTARARREPEAAPAVVARAPAGRAEPPADAAAAPPRASRLGGALLIGAAVALVGIVLAFVFLRGGDEGDPVAEAEATATATATATPLISASDIVLRGPAGSQAVGLMRLFETNDGTLRFALAAQGVAPNDEGETYSLWLSNADGSARLLGDVKDPVGDSGELTTAGPGNDDVDEFPQWLETYETVLVTRDAKDAKKPGTVILKGDLPAAQAGG
jgi:hypothetical protein